jgi:tellurium resistance protein TerD
MNTTVNVIKGQRLDLTKGNPGLKILKVGLGWDVNEMSGVSFDLDAFCFGLNNQGKLADMSHVCYFNQLSILNGAVSHSGDNLTGAGAGDDETIVVNLEKVPASIDKLIIAVNIYDAANKKQNFGMVRNAFVRCYDGENGQELMRYDLGEEYSTFEGVVFGEIYRNNGEWKFGAISNGFHGDINNIISKY